MKRNLMNLKIFTFVCFFMGIANVCAAEGELITQPITLHVESPGNLENQIGWTKAQLITNLTLTGDLNGTDINYLRCMAGRTSSNVGIGGNLYYLDLSGANIVEGGKEYFNWNGRYDRTTDNSVGDYMFHQCTLVSVKLPKSTKYIGSNAFSGCKNLEEVDIPDGVELIDGLAFYDCGKLSSITIPNSVTTLEGMAFEGCKKLKEAKLSDGLKKIENDCFNFCSSLEKVTMPKDLEVISWGAFSDCTSLKNIDIPRTVTKIDKDAFESCTALASVNITDFNAWSHITFGETNKEYYAPQNSNPVYYAKHLYVNGVEIDNVNIPSDIIGIGANAYCGMESLKKANIHSNVISVGNNAFYGCKNMSEIYVYAIKPPKATKSCFDGIDKQSCTLYVPRGTYMDYFLAEGWGDFLNIVEFDATGIDNPDLSCKPKPVDYYNINGMKTTRQTKGLNILRMSDGTYMKTSF